MSIRRLILLGICLAIAVFLTISFNNVSIDANKTINVYGWYGIIPREIFNDFERETGLKIIYDVYDTNDSLEAKLLATNSGYDIVFPSYTPYAARQHSMGVYLKLDRRFLPNLKNIEGILTEEFRKSGGDTDYLIPIFWGTIGVAYESNCVDREFPNEKIDSYSILFDANKVKKLTKYGVSFPEEYTDVLPQLKHYLQIKDKIKNLKTLKTLANYLKGVRQYITKFSSTTLINDLLSGEVCIAIGPSDNAFRAIKAAPSVGKNVKYFIPKESGNLWIDCVGILKKAPHKKNAYKFLNYLLQPEVAAKITNHSGIVVNIPEAVKYFNPIIKQYDQICPTDPKVLKTLRLEPPSQTEKDLEFDRIANRVWSQLKMNIYK
ncbi:MAG: extracellular solute-binding protein [Holosporales bacterium]|jgi:putrescine transport system substrate-binding protein|nr:extracellular solute-binding protein [Holosporales bacterium]